MKITLINCYFGKLPNYFPLWLQSCRANSKVDFLFVTDSVMDSYEIPENVHVIQKKWEELLNKIQKKFPFKIAVCSPYKLTDFKPAYGYIFEEELSDSDYWGYCDVDLVFGDILKYVEPRMEEGYEKIYRLGHLTILKNTPEMVHLFDKMGGTFNFEEVFSNKEFYSFDEHAGLMSISKKHNVKEYYREEMADISCRIKRMTASRHENYKYQVFYYEKGAVYRAYSSQGHLEIDEFVYIHFQKRKLEIEDVGSSYYILSDRIVRKETDGMPTEETIKALSEFESEEIDKKQVKEFRLRKLKKFLCESIKGKSIWIKIKLAERKYIEL